MAKPSMTDDELHEATNILSVGLQVSGAESPSTRERRAAARRVAAELVTELRRLRTVVDAINDALHKGVSERASPRVQ